MSQRQKTTIKITIYLSSVLLWFITIKETSPEKSTALAHSSLVYFDEAAHYSYSLLARSYIAYSP